MNTAILAMLLALPHSAAPPAGYGEPQHIGRIFIAGTDVTPHAEILDVLHEASFMVGRPLPGAAQRLFAEVALALRFPTRFDFLAGNCPTLTVVKGAGAYRDIVIRFPERPTKPSP